MQAQYIIILSLTGNKITPSNYTFLKCLLSVSVLHSLWLNNNCKHGPKQLPDFSASVPLLMLFPPPGMLCLWLSTFLSLPSPHHTHLLKTSWPFKTLSNTSSAGRPLSRSVSHAAGTDCHPLVAASGSLCTSIILPPPGVKLPFPWDSHRALYAVSFQHTVAELKCFNKINF